MRFAFADPPYVGCSKLYDHPEAHVWDDPARHIELMAAMDAEYDAWALSLHEPSLRALLCGAPEGVRTAAWCKPFASYKRGVDPAYTWEPVIYRTVRGWNRDQPTTRDHLIEPPALAENITLQKGLAGAKPHRFWLWLFDLLGARPDDEFLDLFPGTEGGSRAWSNWRAHHPDSQTNLRLAP